jgi:hypothetical protein
LSNTNHTENKEWSTEQNTKHWVTLNQCGLCCSMFSVLFCRSLFVFSVVYVAQCLVFCSVDHCLFSITQNTKHWGTQTTLKTNNDLQNTKHWATQTSLKTNNDLQNTKHWATQTPLKTNNGVDHCLFSVGLVLLNV